MILESTPGTRSTVTLAVGILEIRFDSFRRRPRWQLSARAVAAVLCWVAPAAICGCSTPRCALNRETPVQTEPARLHGEAASETTEQVQSAGPGDSESPATSFWSVLESGLKDGRMRARFPQLTALIRDNPEVRLSLLEHYYSKDEVRRSVILGLMRSLAENEGVVLSDLAPLVAHTIQRNDAALVHAAVLARYYDFPRRKEILGEIIASTDGYLWKTGVCSYLAAFECDTLDSTNLQQSLIKCNSQKPRPAALASAWLGCRCSGAVTEAAVVIICDQLRLAIRTGDDAFAADLFDHIAEACSEFDGRILTVAAEAKAAGDAQLVASAQRVIDLAAAQRQGD